MAKKRAYRKFFFLALACWSIIRKIAQSILCKLQTSFAFREEEIVKQKGYPLILAVLISDGAQSFEVIGDVE